jgi:hypothetical protein
VKCELWQVIIQNLLFNISLLYLRILRLGYMYGEQICDFRQTCKIQNSGIFRSRVLWVSDFMIGELCGFFLRSSASSSHYGNPIRHLLFSFHSLTNISEGFLRTSSSYGSAFRSSVPFQAPLLESNGQSTTESNSHSDLHNLKQHIPDYLKIKSFCPPTDKWIKKMWWICVCVHIYNWRISC